MEIKMVPLSAITPYENNPRKNADAVKYVRKSIEQFGFKVPMVLDAQNVIVCGHTRFLAAQEMGMEEVPCVYADDLSEEQIKAFRLADNKTAEMSVWDFEKLEIEIQGISEIDMSDFGFADAPDVTDEPVSENDPSFNYAEQYGVIVMCSDEADQESVYNKLVEEGYTCKVVAV